jgi:flagellar biogenesis protein FliO
MAMIATAAGPSEGWRTTIGIAGALDKLLLILAVAGFIAWLVRRSQRRHLTTMSESEYKKVQAF